MYTEERELLRTSLVSRKTKTILRKLFQVFTYEGKELFLVGGVVRDLLLGKKPKDFDLCTNATPQEAKAIVEKYGFGTYDTGIKHGTITILDSVNNLSFECTTYRCDGLYSDGRHPESVEYINSLEEDLKRRDFTINSFAYNLLNHQVYMLSKEYLRDLEFGIIQTVGKPENRFNEDALRMMRAIRFSALLGFVIEENTYNAIINCKENITHISKERIRDELTKIIMSDNPQLLELVFVTGLAEYLPEIKPIGDMLTCEHETPCHYTDVFHHTMDVVKGVPKTFNLRWAALLHDIGKPSVKRLKEDTTNQYVYHGHEKASVELAENVMTTLRFSNAEQSVIEKYIKFHDVDMISCSNKTFKKYVTEIGEENFLDFIKLRKADSLAHWLSKSSRYVLDISKVYKRYEQLILTPQPLRTKDLAVDGYDLLALGYKGKQIGIIMNTLLDMVLEKPELNTKEQLLDIIKKENK